MIVECEDDCTGMHNAGVGSRNRFTPGNFCVVASTLLIKVLCSSSGSSELRVAPTSIPVIFLTLNCFYFHKTSTSWLRLSYRVYSPNSERLESSRLTLRGRISREGIINSSFVHSTKVKTFIWTEAVAERLFVFSIH